MQAVVHDIGGVLGQVSISLSVGIGLAAAAVVRYAPNFGEYLPVGADSHSEVGAVLLHCFVLPQLCPGSLPRRFRAC